MDKRRQMKTMSLNLHTFGPVSFKDEELMHDWIRIELLWNSKYNI